MKNPLDFFTKGSKGLLVLLDPDKWDVERIKKSNTPEVSAYLVGGSKLERGSTRPLLKTLKAITQKQVFLFPGDEFQLAKPADGVLLPVLLSGRNADYLIGKQVLMAPVLNRLKLPVLSMAYVLIEGGKPSSTQRVTRTKPLPASDVKTFENTLRAANYLGYALLYIEAGSGASQSVSNHLIRRARRLWPRGLIVGGGFTGKTAIEQAFKSGADWVVVGTALEKNPMFVNELAPLHIF